MLKLGQNAFFSFLKTLFCPLAGTRVRAGARAMLKLGQRFRIGRGVKRDPAKAVDWYTQRIPMKAPPS
jgi:TPR repeat protein